MKKKLLVPLFQKTPNCKITLEFKKYSMFNLSIFCIEVPLMFVKNGKKILVFKFYKV